MHVSSQIRLAPILLIALGCASSSPSRPGNKGGAETVTIDVPGANTSRVVVRRDDSGATLVLAVPAARAWAAVPAAYNALSIPIVALDTSARSIESVTSGYRQFLHNPVSRFVDCGSTITGPNADTYRVQFTIDSQLVPLTDSTSTLRTRVDASGASSVGATARCSTTGSLEAL